MRRLILAAACGLLAIATLAAPVGAKSFGTIFSNDLAYRTFGNPANVPVGTGTDPFAKFTNSDNPDQAGVTEFAPGAASAGGHHGGRWAVYTATFTASADKTELVTSWGELQQLVTDGKVILERQPDQDFRCPVLGNPSPIGG